MRPLPRSFYQQETDLVARALLGTNLVRILPDGRRLCGRVVETEAYLGPKDAASHARSGRTRRNSAMYGPAGYAYVYFTYGMHWMLNIVSHRNYPAGAVLLRAIEPLEGVEWMRALRGDRPTKELTNGPAKLCQALQVTGELNGVDLCSPSGPLAIEVGRLVPDTLVDRGPRIGICYAAEPWRSRPFRFWIRNSQFASR